MFYTTWVHDGADETHDQPDMQLANAIGIPLGLATKG
jgi:hypothetical protein